METILTATKLFGSLVLPNGIVEFAPNEDSYNLILIARQTVPYDPDPTGSSNLYGPMICPFVVFVYYLERQTKKLWAIQFYHKIEFEEKRK